MKAQPQYIEGQQALENFKKLASAVIQTNPQKQKKQIKKPISSRKTKNADKN